MDKEKQKTIIITLIIVALLFGVAFYYSGGKGKSDNSVVALKNTNTGAGALPSGNGGREVFKMLTVLKSIKLDTKFFNDDVFQSLNDFSVELSPEEVGRINPFAPLRKTQPAVVVDEEVVGN